MISSSKVAQPTHWMMFRPVARYEPRRPSGARSSTIAGTRASLPISAAAPSITLPSAAPTTIASSVSGSEQRGHEDRPGDDDQQADGEVRPEQAGVEEAEDAEAVGHGLDAPGGRLGVQHGGA